MTFERIWDASCPKVWDRWESDGTTYVIQDLPPEDDEAALDILVEYQLPEEVMYKIVDLKNDLDSVQDMCEVWKGFLKRRTSLACYAEKDSGRRLVAVNVCFVKKKDDAELPIRGEKWKRVNSALKYVISKADPFESLGLDLVLRAAGLVVVKDCRGAKLGAKMLAAREPLCRHLGIKGTATIFTSIESQKSAARAGFTELTAVMISELAAAGLGFPEDDDRVVKMMIKKYD